MRLWHETLIPYLPNNQLKGQHRECCALRGNGWNKSHSVVNYVFKYNPFILYLYHTKIMVEIDKRNLSGEINYKIKKSWIKAQYRNDNNQPWNISRFEGFNNDLKHDNYMNYGILYKEHNHLYLIQCLKNLSDKGIEIRDLLVPMRKEMFDYIKVT